MGRKRDGTEEMLARAVEAGRQLERQQIVAQTARQIFAEEIREVLEALTSTEAALNYITRAIPRWIDRWRQRMSGPLLQQMQMTELPTNRGNVRLGFDLGQPKLREYFDDYMLRLSTQITDTTREKLERIIRESAQDGFSVDEAARRIREVGEEFQGGRSDLIARTELLNASRGAADIRARESGVISGKKWLATNDTRTRPEHRALDGMEVGLDEDFPGEGQIPSKPNCRCSLLYLLDKGVLGGAA